MIQAPQMQYMAVPGQPTYMVPNTNTPVQNNIPQQNQGYIYNYPTSSCYNQPYGAGKSQFNGVNIEILNPQGQGIDPNYQPAYYLPPQQQYNLPYNFAVPGYINQTVYQAPAQPQAPAQQQAPAQPQAPAIMPAQVQPQTVAPQVQPVTVPAPVITQSPAQAQQTSALDRNTLPQAPVVQEPVVPNSNISPETFAGKLKTTDLDAQRNALTNVAELVKNDDTAGYLLLDTQIFDALVDIIDKDTSSLEGPSPEVIELRQKPQDKLTDEEKTKAFTPTPLEKAEINKQYALYTISYMQERVNNELIKKTDKGPLELKDLPCIDKVVDSVKSNPDPLVRIAALSALSHIARPEYKNDLSTIFEIAKSDEDKKVREAATKHAEALSQNL